MVVSATRCSLSNVTRLGLLGKFFNDFSRTRGRVGSSRAGSRRSQWSASETGTGKITILIKHHRGSGLPQTEQIKNLLNEAIQPSRDRDLLARGTWWCFDRRTLTIEVRGGVRWGQPELPPEHREYTVSDILKVAHKFKNIEAELYKIRRSLEPKVSEAEMRAASSFLRARYANNRHQNTG
jgi:hypothetical protein